MDKNSLQLAQILTAQIVHELRNLPRGTTPKETITMLEAAYKMSSSLEDVLKAAAEVTKVAA